MAGKPKWTPEQKTQALNIYAEHGPARASTRTGIPAQTISGWAKQAGVPGPTSDKTREAREGRRQRWEEYRGDLLLRLGGDISVLLDAAVQLVQSGAEVRDGDRVVATGKEAQALVTSAAILIDKAQVLSGGVSDRVDFGALPADERAARLLSARDDLAAARSRRAS